MGDGFQIKGEGVCIGLIITIAQNFLSLQLRNIDVILGLEWLFQLGKVKAN